jgi:hypothetical protein
MIAKEEISTNEMEYYVPPKDQRGIGIQNLKIHNQCLLSKLLFKLINEERL